MAWFYLLLQRKCIQISLKVNIHTKRRSNTTLRTLSTPKKIWELGDIKNHKTQKVLQCPLYSMVSPAKMAVRSRNITEISGRSRISHKIQQYLLHGDDVALGKNYPFLSSRQALHLLDKGTPKTMVVPKYLRVFSSNNSSVVYIYPRILASSSACGVCTAAAEVVANHAVWFPPVSLTGCLSPCLSVSSSHSTSRVWLEVESALSIHFLELIGNE